MIKGEVFIFLGSKFVDHSTQFENHQAGLLYNLYENNIIDFKDVIMSVFIPESNNLKTENLQTQHAIVDDLVKKNSINLDIMYVPGKKIKNLFIASKQLKERTRLFSKKIIFAQNYYSGFIGFCLKKLEKNIYIHTNLRGLPAEEELRYSDSFLLRRLANFFVLKWIEKKVISASNSFSVVSEQHKSYLKKKIKGSSKRIVVYPCAYNPDKFFVDDSLRKIYRDKFNIQEQQKVFIYSGSMNKYQMPAKIFKFYENISNQDNNHNCVFIFLTFDKNDAEHLAGKFSIHNLLIKTMYGKDLLGIYNASDIGVVCRKNDIVNRVASPTKIAEYLATGNSMILTDGIGDYSQMLRDKNFVIVKKNIDAFLKTNLTELLNLIKPNKNDLFWIEKNFSVEKIKVFNKIFSKDRFRLETL